jgi:1,4-dihydroxy-2-naphthoyl-CoA hydrolase
MGDPRHEAGTIHEALDIEVVEATTDRVVLRMPVTTKVYQPMGSLHGGASAVLAESAASIGAWLNCDPERQQVVGTDLNVSHLRARSEGILTAVATPIRKGRSIHVWNVEITDQDATMIAVSRCTLMVRDTDRSREQGSR